MEVMEMNFREERKKEEWAIERGESEDLIMSISPHLESLPVLILGVATSGAALHSLPQCNCIQVNEL